MTYPHVEPGDEITLDLVNGMVGVHGTVTEVELDDQGAIRCLSIIDDPGREPLRIAGDKIVLWRKGAPIRRLASSGLAVPAPPAGLAGNGGR